MDNIYALKQVYSQFNFKKEEEREEEGEKLNNIMWNTCEPVCVSVWLRVQSKPNDGTKRRNAALHHLTCHRLEGRHCILTK